MPDDLTILLSEQLLNGAKVLDLGCGEGKNLIFLKLKTFDVYGTDVDDKILEKARLNCEQLNQEIQLHPMKDKTSLPFKDQFFDAVLSTYAIYHMELDKIKLIVDEIQRVLRPGGLFYATVLSTRDFKYGEGEKIDHNTFRVGSELEQTEVHRFFDKQELYDLFSYHFDFKWVHTEKQAAYSTGGKSVEIEGKVGAHWIIKSKKKITC